MKTAVYITCLIGVVACGVSSPVPGESTIDLEAIAKMTIGELDQLAGGLAAEELIRTKRSGSGDILGSVSKTISSGISSKLALIGQASAGASALLSGSKGGDHHHTGYSYDMPMTYHTKAFDFWTLKKSILNTLLQAVKAITGGVTILKGQLIKGGGALVSGVGKIVSVKGEAVTSLGRHIVNSASLVPPKKKLPIHAAPAAIHIPATAPVHIHHHTAPSGPAVPVSSYGPPSAHAHFTPTAHYGVPPTASHYDAPTAAAPIYGAPIAHNALFSAPNKYSHAFEGRKQGGVQAGFIFLQPLDSHASHSSPTSSSPLVTSALQALKGILTPSAGSPPTASSHSINHVITHESSPPTAPSSYDDYKDPISHPPPPPPPPTGESYSSYANQDLPSFKPMPYDLNDKLLGPITSYGEVIPRDSKPNLQTMVDGLLKSQYETHGFPDPGPSYESYLSSFPNSDSPHPAESSISLTYTKKLQPLEISKIVQNVDKINLKRADSRMLTVFDPFNLYTKMAATKADEQMVENVENKTEGRKAKTSENILGGKNTSNVDVEKSITYELRGNRIIRLTDGIADV